MHRFLLAFTLFFALPFHADSAMSSSDHLVEPTLRLAPRQGGMPRVALTLDACSGRIDHRILDVLIRERIAATIFVTARWLRRNAEATAVLKAHPDLFELEDHGREHLAAIDRAATIYGVKSAGSAEALALEVDGGADAMAAAGLPKPRWFRGATAQYSPSAMALIESMGYRVAGYSLNGDGGSRLAAGAAERRIAAARDGDVILAHINQPDHPAGEGVAAGILALRKRGFEFVVLKDAAEPVGKKLHSSVIDK